MAAARSAVRRGRRRPGRQPAPSPVRRGHRAVRLDRSPASATDLPRSRPPTRSPRQSCAPRSTPWTPVCSCRARSTTPMCAPRFAARAAVDVIAAGKAAAPMLDALAPPRRACRCARCSAIGPRRGPETRSGFHRRLPGMTPGIRCRTTAAWPGRAGALEVAAASGERDLLLVLLSGGGSALMALPAPEIPLEEKQHTARTLHGAGRRHLRAEHRAQASVRDQGRPACRSPRGAMCSRSPSRTSSATTSRSSRPGRRCPTTARLPRRSTCWHAAAVIVVYPEAVVARLRRGAAGAVPETPTRGDSRLARAQARVIGPQRGAIDGASRAAATLGYHVHVVAEPVTGEARAVAGQYIERAARAIASMPRPVCVIASGETTVTVTRRGKGRAQPGVRVCHGQFASGARDARRRREHRHRRHRRPDRRGRRHRRSHNI